MVSTRGYRPIGNNSYKLCFYLKMGRVLFALSVLTVHLATLFGKFPQFVTDVCGWLVRSGAVYGSE